MVRIAFIGAGSFGFTRSLVRDILTFPLIKDAELVLMDIDRERLAFITRAVQRLVDLSGSRARVIPTMNRREALRGANAVICTILAGGVKVWRFDTEIPAKYGVSMNVGDTRSVGGIFRALRTIPVMVSICKDMQDCCPNAILLNYTNPMAMLCRAMQRSSSVTVTGLCHSVQGTSEMLARWIGASLDEITYVCAGINHMAWFIEYKKNGKDAYPLIREAVRRKDIYDREVVRNEMFRHLGYYVTESSGHNSEYNWWFRKRPDLLKKYCKTLPCSDWNPGEHAFILKSYLRTEKTWKKTAAQWFRDPVSLERGHEYAAYIINAWQGGGIYTFNGNVPNENIIPNLPYKACVEVPVLASKGKLQTMHVGPLPPQCAALTSLSAQVEEMAVEAALTGNPELVFQALAFDPLSAAVLSLAEIKKMTQEMLAKNKPFLPQFKSVKI